MEAILCQEVNRRKYFWKLRNRREFFSLKGMFSQTIRKKVGGDRSHSPAMAIFQVLLVEEEISLMVSL